MNPDYRQRLLGIRARLDRPETDASALLDEPGDTDNIPTALKPVESLMDMRATIEANLGR
jgi:hypothetical protein